MLTILQKEAKTAGVCGPSSRRKTGEQKQGDDDNSTTLGVQSTSKLAQC
jgi:hypothetical protein